MTSLLERISGGNASNLVFFLSAFLSSVVQGTTVVVTFRLDSTLRKIALATGEVTTVGARGQFTATDMSGFGRYGKAHDFPGRLSAVMRPPEVDRKCGIV